MSSPSRPLAAGLVARLVVIASVLILQACATSQSITTARDQFRHGSTDAALQTLSEADVSNRDKLLLLLDTALVAQAAGRYEQSIVAFEDAYKLIEKLDYISARDQSAALVTSDWAIRYSGEFSERLWIHTFQMINYLLLDQPGGAAVEARRAVALYKKHGDVLDNDLFTRYLMALSFESAGQLDSAMVEYRKLEKELEPDAFRTRHSSSRELTVLVATGFIEPKQPGDLFIDINARVSFPYYPDVYERAPDIEVIADKKSLKATRVDTRLLSIAQDALAKRGKTIASRHALRLAAKYSLAQSIEEQDPLAGGLARLFLLALEQADTRSWETLPAYLSLVRVKIPTDLTSVNIRIEAADSSHSNFERRTVQFDLDEGGNQFRMIRIGVQDSQQQVVNQ
ncbi:MAG: hypothetical protein AB8B87_25295 [Granulosicoccus sp.]